MNQSSCGEWLQFFLFMQLGFIFERILISISPNLKCGSEKWEERLQIWKSEMNVIEHDSCKYG